MKQDFLEMIRNILDHELIDSNNIPCGKVDDLEIVGEPGKNLKVVAILTGRSTVINRMPAFARRILQRFVKHQEKRIPWEEVLVITAKVKLNHTYQELGLNQSDEHWGKFFKKVPGG
jgi:hypothetical protein